MQIYGAYTRGIDGHLFAVSATPNPAGPLHVAGVRDTVAQHTATTVTHALKRLGICDVGADVRLEPAGAADPRHGHRPVLGHARAADRAGLARRGRQAPHRPNRRHRGRRRPRPVRRERESRRAVHQRRAGRPPSPTPRRRAASG